MPSPRTVVRKTLTLLSGSSREKELSERLDTALSQLESATKQVAELDEGRRLQREMIETMRSRRFLTDDSLDQSERERNLALALGRARVELAALKNDPDVDVISTPPGGEVDGSADDLAVALSLDIAKLNALVEDQRVAINRLQPKKMDNRTQLSLDRIDTFFDGKALTLPPEPFAQFEEKCRSGSPERADAFLADLAESGYRPLLEQLFTPEMAMAQGMNYQSLEPVISFQRGDADIKFAEARGQTIDELKANHIRITIDRFDKLISDDMIDPSRVDAVCEIGAAWGAATRYMLNRYKPETFHVYEIDTAWAQWLEDNLGVDSKNCDGESLAFTEDESMDICVASSCLYFMPWVKQWNYLSEFARVLKPGGIAVFNVNLVERIGIRTLKGLLNNYFPRREFGYLPEHCMRTALPEDRFEQLTGDPKETEYYYVFRKRG